jgi:hypothetical protein
MRAVADRLRAGACREKYFQIKSARKDWRIDFSRSIRNYFWGVGIDETGTWHYVSAIGIW